MAKIYLLFIVVIGILAVMITESFVDCGCGCCGGMEPTAKSFTWSKSAFEERNKIDQEHCAFVGCSPGVTYYYLNFGKIIGREM